MNNLNNIDDTNNFIEEPISKKRKIILISLIFSFVAVTALPIFIQ